MTYGISPIQHAWRAISLQRDIEFYQALQYSMSSIYTNLGVPPDVFNPKLKESPMSHGDCITTRSVDTLDQDTMEVKFSTGESNPTIVLREVGIRGIPWRVDIEINYHGVCTSMRLNKDLAWELSRYLHAFHFGEHDRLAIPKPMEASISLTDHQERTKKIREENAELAGKIRRHERSIEGLEASKTNLHARVDTYARNALEMEKALEEIKTSRDSLATQLSDSQTLLKDRMERIERLKTQLSEHREQIQKLATERDKCIDEAALSDIQCAGLRRLLDIEQTELERIQAGATHPYVLHVTTPHLRSKAQREKLREEWKQYRADLNKPQGKPFVVEGGTSSLEVMRPNGTKTKFVPESDMIAEREAKDKWIKTSAHNLQACADLKVKLRDANARLVTVNKRLGEARTTIRELEAILGEIASTSFKIVGHTSVSNMASRLSIDMYNTLTEINNKADKAFSTRPGQYSVKAEPTVRDGFIEGVPYTLLQAKAENKLLMSQLHNQDKIIRKTLQERDECYADAARHSSKCDCVREVEKLKAILEKARHVLYKIGVESSSIEYGPNYPHQTLIHVIAEIHKMATAGYVDNREGSMDIEIAKWQIECQKLATANKVLETARDNHYRNWQSMVIQHNAKVAAGVELTQARDWARELLEKEQEANRLKTEEIDSLHNTVRWLKDTNASLHNTRHLAANVKFNNLRGKTNNLRQKLLDLSVTIRDESDGILARDRWLRDIGVMITESKPDEDVIDAIAIVDKAAKADSLENELKGVKSTNENLSATVSQYSQTVHNLETKLTIVIDDLDITRGSYSKAKRRMIRLEKLLDFARNGLNKTGACAQSHLREAQRGRMVDFIRSTLSRIVEVSGSHLAGSQPEFADKEAD